MKKTIGCFTVLWTLFTLAGVPVLFAAAPLTKGPYLLPPQRDAITIRWETDRAIDTFVRYGLPGKSTRQAKATLRGIKNGAYLYETTLTSLTAGGVYRYQVQAEKTKTRFYSFHLPSMTAQNCDFVAMGDSRSQPKMFSDIVALTSRHRPEFIISMGDLVANGGAADEWPRFYFQPAESLIACVPLVSTLGDHEGEGDNGELFRHFLLAGESVDAQWFSFDWGPAHFVSLDYRHPDDPRMIEWFKKDMESSTARWKFVYMHRPCYNFGGHRSFWGACRWPQLFRKYQVDIVFTGHSHQYERFYPARPAANPDEWPVTYITTGGAGAGLYEVMQHPFLAAAVSEHHLVTVNIRQDTLRLAALRPDGSAIDRMEMVKAGKSYTREYLDLIIPQERLDLINAFAQALTFSVTQIPQIYRPYKHHFSLSLCPGLKEVGYSLGLAPSSTAHYRMASIADTLDLLNSVETELQIFGLGDVTVSGWGDMKPPLQLQVVIRSPLGEDRIIGGAVEYWPGDEY